MGCGDRTENGKGVWKELRGEGWKKGRLEGETRKEGGKGGRLEGDMGFICNVGEKGVADMVVAVASFIERCLEIS